MSKMNQWLKENMAHGPMPWYYNSKWLIWLGGVMIALLIAGFVTGFATWIVLLMASIFIGPLLVAYGIGKKKWDTQLIDVFEKKDELQRELDFLEKLGLKEVVDRHKELLAVEKKLEDFERRYIEKKRAFTNLQEDYIELEEEVLYQSYGVFQPMYDFATAHRYKEALADVRKRQKEMIRKKEATVHELDWEVNGSKQQGKKMTNDSIRLALRAFNNECDTIVSKVTIANFEASKKRMHKSQEMINRMNEINRVQITDEYVSLKEDELQLALEWELQKEREKEEARERRAAEREEKRIAKEIEEKKKTIEKEEKHFAQALEQMQLRLQETQEGEQMEALREKIRLMEQQLTEKKKEKEDLDYRSANTRAGYVYIVSNIGTLGEDVFKIGMTRRLEPMDRIQELSSASVPFKYDVHAMIFSEDAPALEKRLHEQFDEHRVNKVNMYKEFFKLPLEEIERAIAKYHDQTVEVKHVTPAEEYRETLALLKMTS